MEKPTARQIALVTFNSIEYGPNRAPYFQVTINPDHISPDGKYIRFGDISGDEIVGWVELEEIDIHSVLYDYPANISLHYTNQDVGMQLLARLNEQLRLEKTEH